MNGSALKFISYSSRLQAMGHGLGLRSQRVLGGLQFGLEAEYETMSALLNHYWPSPALRQEWEIEADWPERLRERIRSAAHGSREILLERRPNSSQDLPGHLFRDDTGNLELHGKINNEYLSWCSQVDFLSDTLGAASWQGMISLPRDTFFEPGLEAVSGFLNFFHEADILYRLDRGPSFSPKEPARTFTHPYLGPMTELRHRLQRKFLRENYAGRMLDPEDLLRPAHRDQSFKFVGSTAYRPDVAGPERMSLEIRDCHRDTTLLKERVARVVYLWGMGLEGFSRFSGIPSFPASDVFAGLPHPVQNRLKHLFPPRAPEIVKNFPKALEAYEVFRNFSYPLRDWGPWVAVLGVNHASVLQAQEAYLSVLQKIASASTSTEADSSLVQQALVDFARSSGLVSGFFSMEQELSC
jgi:hypothetical protein